MILVEKAGLRTTLVLNFKGDVKRETRWLAQYGQAVCALVAAWLIFQLDPPGRRWIEPMLTATFGVSIVAMLVKRLFGRVRPNRENAGKFMGPTWRHANFRESFPSSHSAAAMAMSGVLAIAFPPGAPVFFTLAVLCAALRYVLDAHWLSDVLGGMALGYAAAQVTVHVFRMG
jgi:membrane-associated phospholipid phosphatase